MRNAIPLLLALGTATGPAMGQIVGGGLADLAPVELANTAATSLGDYTGRLLLIEYFAYW